MKVQTFMKETFNFAANLLIEFNKQVFFLVVYLIVSYFNLVESRAKLAMFATYTIFVLWKNSSSHNHNKVKWQQLIVSKS